MLRLKLHPDAQYDEKHDETIGRELVESNLDHEVLFEDLIEEVTEELESDDAVEFSAEEVEEEATDVKYYIDSDNEGHSGEDSGDDAKKVADSAR